MKVGDVVTRTNLAGGESWRVIEMKTDARTYWIRLDTKANKKPNNNLIGEGVWHDARYFEVMEKQK